ncbi:Serine/threonine-protein kinase PknD [Pseudobythopirellula maris]|uniref:Serine/threonine-protein kinase PknD n=1 Tax=Pseudobythopirellula maris TaxID=2527991 RepID=A0A5C5ZR04_9BACT|nr:PAS domain S-box protein [Pseudobythopirellula maris]TWT89710.1 Serine/threonine-protein kinase PknD [Pseudobythopirellula maris]
MTKETTYDVQDDPEGSEHPDEIKLVEWVGGALSEDELARIDQHLESCEQCAARLDAIESEDPFVRHLRGQVSDTEPTAAVADEGLKVASEALQRGLITSDQLATACLAWRLRPQVDLAQLLVDRGWLDPSTRTELVGEVRSAELGAVGDGSHVFLLHGIDLKRVHSTGGIGRVWLARDRVLGRRIALKELLPENARSASKRERFFREARIAAQMNHPGMVPVHGYHDAGGRCYYTMQFVGGATLTEVIADYHAGLDRTADPDYAALLTLLDHFCFVCDTIAYAHSRGVIHRDLKGDNVLVGDFGEVRVLDWGLAKKLERGVPGRETPSGADPTEEEDLQSDQEPAGGEVDEALLDATISASGRATMQGERLGTPAYMAPEQASGEVEEVDSRTDVYGLAALLYEVLAGRPPFQGDRLNELLHRVIHENPKPPSDLAPHVPVELERVCLKGLAKRRGDRQQSVRELRQEVRSWVVDRTERKRTEQERERFFAISHDLLAIVDARGRIRQANPAWEKTLGWRVDEVLGKRVIDVVHPEDHAHVLRNHKTLRGGTPTLSSEHRHVCKDGTVKWLLWNTTPIPGEAFAYAVGRDITELKRAAGLIG